MHACRLCALTTDIAWFATGPKVWNYEGEKTLLEPTISTLSIYTFLELFVIVLRKNIEWLFPKLSKACSRTIYTHFSGT